MHATVVAAIIVALGLIAFLYRLRKIAATKRAPDFTRTCGWARALFHNRLISMEELNQFMASHRKCPTCIPDGDENANGEVR